MKKIWIDLDNTPHVPLFAPIIGELERRGYTVAVTARDAFQVRELADHLGLKYRLIGRHFGKNMVLKITGLVLRSMQLMPTAVNERPDLAISHGSRSQLVIGTALRIPTLMICDYEHSTIWAGIQPTWVMAPDVIPPEAMRCDRKRILSYPGIKEDVYVPRFKPDLTTRRRLGMSADDIVVLIRPPATEAHYHNPESEILFRSLIDHLANSGNVRMIVLPRNVKQKELIAADWSRLVEAGKIVFPAKVENGLDLIWASDLVVSGGGTMNREAAALRVPVYSIFRGQLGAVDRSLEANRRLILLSTIEDFRSRLALERRKSCEDMGIQQNETLTAIVDNISWILDRVR